jgi:hypothetical protein
VIDPALRGSFVVHKTRSQDDKIRRSENAGLGLADQWVRCYTIARGLSLQAF